MGTGIIILLVIVLAAILLLAMGYLKAPPDTAYIISGMSKRRILIGKAGWRIPFLERVDKISLQVMTVDVKTSEAVPTNEFINVMVDGVANVKVSSDPALLDRAAESLLGMKQQELIAMVTQVLEGNMREIVGSVGLKEMVQDRQGVAKKITENVVPDMQKLGIEVVNFNIQNFRDNAGTIENMGIDNVEQIRKNAQIAKANAQRDIAIASSRAQQEANAVKVDSEKNMAEQNAELAVQQAEMQVRADTKKAEADAAYSIQQENQRKTIEITRANADIARREKEAELAEKEIAIKERQLEAEGIRAKGLAEAEAIEKKADAQKRMGEASIVEMVLAALPEVVKNAALPLAQTDKIVIYGDGNATKLVRDVMGSGSQVLEGIRESTGIDLAGLLAGYAGGKLSARETGEKPAQEEASDEKAPAEEANKQE